MFRRLTDTAATEGRAGSHRQNSPLSFSYSIAKDQSIAHEAKEIPSILGCFLQFRVGDSVL